MLKLKIRNFRCFLYIIFTKKCRSAPLQFHGKLTPRRAGHGDKYGDDAWLRCMKGSTEKWEMEMKGKDRNHRIGEIGMDMECMVLTGRLGREKNGQIEKGLKISAPPAQFVAPPASISWLRPWSLALVLALKPKSLALNPKSFLTSLLGALLDFQLTYYILNLTTWRWLDHRVNCWKFSDLQYYYWKGDNFGHGRGEQYTTNYIRYRIS